MIQGMIGTSTNALLVTETQYCYFISNEFPLDNQCMIISGSIARVVAYRVTVCAINEQLF